jgi:hypothetical protein
MLLTIVPSIMFLSLNGRAGIAKENHDKVFNEMVQFSPNELQGGRGDVLPSLLCVLDCMLLCPTVALLV